MNYIAKLQADLADNNRQLTALRESMTQFKAFLHGPKFTGTDNGERKDWIATGDVLNWIRETESSTL